MTYKVYKALEDKGIRFTLHSSPKADIFRLIGNNKYVHITITVTNGDVKVLGKKDILEQKDNHHTQIHRDGVEEITNLMNSLTKG